MGEGITEFVQKATSKHGTKAWRAGVGAGIGVLLWMQAQFPTRREFEKMEGQMNRIEEKIDVLQQSNAVLQNIAGRKYE